MRLNQIELRRAVGIAFGNDAEFVFSKPFEHNLSFTRYAKSCKEKLKIILFKFFGKEKRLSFRVPIIMVWGGITIHDRTELVVFRRRTLTAQRYVEEILDVHIRPQAVAAGTDFICMQDGARPHTARMVREYLNQHNIDVLDCGQL